MMSIDTVIRSVLQTDFYRSEVGTNFQIGWPQFEQKNGQLFIKFLPHLEKPDAQGNIAYFAPQYCMVFAAPFHHPVYFANLGYLHEQTSLTPIHTVRVEDLIEQKENILLLYKEAEEIIGTNEQETRKALIAAYADRFQSLAKSLGLEGVYGGNYDSYRNI